ncbi:MAG: cytochrome b [Proteobacteria bacterium]|nr:cytochrome b [Pseudomonadota bacterium]
MKASRYSPWLRRLHWLIALLIFVAWGLAELRGYTPRGSDLRNAVTWTHIQFGFAVILLMLPRLLARMRSATPPITPPLAAWQAWPAKLIHLALYALALLVPVLGMAMQYFKGASWDLFGVPLPVSATPDKALGHDLEEIHETCGNVLFWLAIFHAVAALFHHWITRDDTLKRMLPTLRSGD